MDLMRAIDRSLEAILPPLAFCKVQEAIRSRLGARYHGRLRRSISRRDGVFKMEWGDGSSFHFPHQRRYVHYMKADGAKALRAAMLRKYQDGPVQVPQGGTVIEAGAYCGEFTTAAAEMASAVYSFDPDPTVWESLRLNTQPFPNVHITPSALSDTDGTTHLHLKTSTADSSIFPPEEGFTRKIEVKTARLNTLLEQMGIETVDFLKLEAEGAEPEILRGAGERLKSIRMIAADCGPERLGQMTFSECEDILSAAGFEHWRRQEGVFNMLFAINRN